MSDMPLKDLRRLARTHFAAARTLSDLNRHEFARVNGLSDATMAAVFPRNLWAHMRYKWARRYIRPIMHNVFATCKVRHQFCLSKIIKGSDIDEAVFYKAVGKEWLRMRSSLPTGRELVLSTIKKMLEDNAPESDFPLKNITRKLGISVVPNREIYKAIRDARTELKRRRREQVIVLPPGIDAREVPGGYVDLNACVWDLGLHRGELRKDRLREDFADIAWSHLRRELEARKLALTTVTFHYRDFYVTTQVLGNDFPDVTTATLDNVRRALSNDAAQPSQLRSVRWALLQIYAALIKRAEKDKSINLTEMSNLYLWLWRLSLTRQEPDGYVLSNTEVEVVIDGCLDDIKSGIEFVNSEPEWQSMSALNGGKINASVVARWGSALIILLMCFTGLRRQSVLNLKIGDWVEVRPGVFAISWKHGRMNHDKVAALPEVLAEMLDEYVRCFEGLRRELNTDRVFLINDKQGAWCEIGSMDVLSGIMADFVKRHKIMRDSEPIRLSAMILRRTYTTRELSDGRDIWLLRLQLGHESIGTTMRYAKFELMEHPRQVSDALDTWGRNVLGLWQKPVLLDELTNQERLHLLNEGESRHVEGGRCRHAGCIKLTAGSPPPCTQCEHLVTGPEFLPEWEIIRHDREAEIERLKRNDPNGHQLAQKKCQFELFKSNHQYVASAGMKGVSV